VSLEKTIHAVLATALLGAPALGSAQSTEELAREVQALREQVEALTALKPSFAGFMPGFAERFHVLHAAGDAGDWAVAGHEYQELRAQMSAAAYVDAEKGQLFAAMLSAGFDEIGEAIESGDKKRLGSALGQTIAACNACHQATGSGFIKVTLDTGPVLSLRHSHVFSATAAGGHAHGEAEQGGHVEGEQGGHAEGEKDDHPAASKKTKHD